MEGALRPVLVVGTALVVTLAVGYAVDRALRAADARHPETPLWHLLRRCRLPLQVVLCTAMLRGGYKAAHVASGHGAALGQCLTLVLIGATAWLTVRVAAAGTDSSYARYAAVSRDVAKIRRLRTQSTLIQRVFTAIVGVMAVASMLFSFPEMRTFGASMLASAGVIGIVAGIAAQSTLGNLFAGLQIAFGDMVRIGDTVVVDGEWGTVEEITLTFLSVRTWDERRITMPVSYFTSKPFENWSRGDPRMTGTVFFHLDHAAPVGAMRKRLHEILEQAQEWDRRAWGLVVIDTTPTTIQLRALVTAKDADDVFNLRCIVREQLLDWLREEHPYALPRVSTASAPGAL
ncbi:mechanosensitive ion channel family protein [Actinacidiphila bryophytorum]|uniref:Membrane protein n=1 Tax=Actinacidiphila bryophytorum TaxID=1436133 RepID=A0A9W4EDX2_9ACTN|nr:mechanosensitive ion channel domain-containing protein [Actinacidiphila bryophytorum]MBM9436240.1 mechanosensitive ion channel [Actinacidiphila bryophytorum]MBN6544222.1 mechanosensitive ion channel [Actinacidiphila bryophytorum]CAG7632726.1 putative membrane protein [Actinacidiphila bryophytorum]